MTECSGFNLTDDNDDDEEGRMKKEDFVKVVPWGSQHMHITKSFHGLGTNCSLLVLQNSRSFNSKPWPEWSNVNSKKLNKYKKRGRLIGDLHLLQYIAPYML